MFDININEQNGGYIQKGGSKYQSILSKKVPSQQSKNKYHNVNQISNDGNIYLSFGKGRTFSIFSIFRAQKIIIKKQKAKKKLLIHLYQIKINYLFQNQKEFIKVQIFLKFNRKRKKNCNC